MKRISLLLSAAAIGVTAMAQNTRAVFTGPTGETFIGVFNPQTGTMTDQVSLGLLETTPKDLIYDAANQMVVFQDRMNGLMVGKISGNQVNTMSFGLMNNLIAPAYIPSRQEVVSFNVQTEFNGYGNNEDNLLVSRINTGTGIQKNILRLNDVSFNNAVAPFYGKVETFDRMTGKNVLKDVAVSKGIYIAEKDLYITCMKDVTGTIRLYKIHVSSPRPTYSSPRCEYNIVDMAYLPSGDVVKALYFEKNGSNYLLKTGDLDIATCQMKNSATVFTFTAGSNHIINNGTIEFTEDFKNLFVSFYDGKKTSVKELDQATNTPLSDIQYQAWLQFGFGFPESSYKAMTYTNIFKLYPNPTTGIVHFRNQSGLVPKSIMVYDYLGQLMKSYQVEEMMTDIELDMSTYAPGVYHVAVDMPGEDFIGKVVVTH